MSLEFTLNSSTPAGVAIDCVIVGAFADGLAPAAQAIDAASEGRLAALVARSDVNGKTGSTALLHDLPGVKASRVLVIGLGERAKFGTAQYLKAVGDAARALRTGPCASALLTLTELPVTDRDAAWNIRQAVVAAARELGNLPPNICNPAYLAQQAQEFAGRFPGAECEILGRDAMRELGMGSLLAVSQGSHNEPKLIALKWNNGGDAKPYVLV